MTAKFLLIVSRALCTLLTAVLAVLVWKTGEYFNKIPEADRSKPLLAWDLLVLIMVLCYLLYKLVVG